MQVLAKNMIIGYYLKRSDPSEPYRTLYAPKSLLEPKHTHVYIYIYIYIYVYVHIYIYIYIYMCLNKIGTGNFGVCIYVPTSALHPNPQPS